MHDTSTKEAAPTFILSPSQRHTATEQASLKLHKVHTSHDASTWQLGIGCSGILHAIVLSLDRLPSRVLQKCDVVTDAETLDIICDQR